MLFKKMESDFSKICLVVCDNSFLNLSPYVGKFGSGCKIKWTLRHNLFECVKTSDL